MTKFEKAVIPDEVREKSYRAQIQAWHDGDPVVRAAFPDATSENIEEKFRAAMARNQEDVVYLNDVYQVAVYDNGEVIHLSIKRRDKKPCKDWRHFQQIKNELVGPENEALELYPAESRRVDTANQCHLWVLKDPNQRIYGIRSGLF